MATIEERLAEMLAQVKSLNGRLDAANAEGARLRAEQEKRIDESVAARLQEAEDAARAARPSPSPAPTHITTTHDKSREPKVANPEFFSGARAALTSFLVQLNMVISLQPTRFGTERTKVMFAGSYLRGTALLWFQPYVGQEPADPIMDSFQLFCNKLKELFGDPDEESTAERNLYSLKQRGSATSYLADFRRYSVLVKWNDEAKMSQFYKGLKETIKDEIARGDRPKDLEKMIEQAIKIDTRLFERGIEKNQGDGNRGSTFTPRTFTPNTASTYVKKEWNPANRGNNNSFTPRTTTSTTATSSTSANPLNLTRSGKLPNDEYKKRRDNNLCLYCGSPDHIIAKCPVAKPKSNLRAATARSGSGKA